MGKIEIIVPSKASGVKITRHGYDKRKYVYVSCPECVKPVAIELSYDEKEIFNYWHKCNECGCEFTVESIKTKED